MAQHTSGGPYTKLANVPAGTTQYIDTRRDYRRTYYYVGDRAGTSFNRSPNSNEAAVQAQAQMVAVTFTSRYPQQTRTGRTVHIAGSFPRPTPVGPGRAAPDPRGRYARAHHPQHARRDTSIEYKYTLGIGTMWRKAQPAKRSRTAAHRHLWSRRYAAGERHGSQLAAPSRPAGN